MEKLIIDSFAGGGGASLGIAWALGRAPHIAINHDPSAIAMHAANHPSTEHVLEDVWKADLRGLVGKREVGALWASPDCTFFSRARGGQPLREKGKAIRSLAWIVCKWAEQVRPSAIFLENVREFCFPGDTTVLTKRGIVPIAEVIIGDFVMTHNNRWRAVVAKSESRKQVVTLNGGGNNLIRSTADHRFYARKIDAEITKSGKRGKHRSQILEPCWLKASELAPSKLGSSYEQARRGVAWASPRAFPRYWMRLPTIKLGNAESPAFFYMLGRWLGDGWIKNGIKRKKSIRICCAKYETDDLQQRLDSTGMRFQLVERRESVDIFEAFDVGLVKWIKANFREKAHFKTLPAWVFTAPRDYRLALIQGWADSDAHVTPDGKCGGCSVSKCLAVGMKLLLQSIGISCSVGIHSEPKEHVIEGKLCWSTKSYYVTWHWNGQWQKGWKTKRHVWNRVRTVSEPSLTEEIVYDITVDEDHSFVADGMVVHNCDWGPLVPKLSCRVCEWSGTEGQATLARVHHRCPRCNASRLRQFPEMVPNPLKKGLTFKRWVGRLQSLGYKVEWKVLNAADYGAPTHRRRLFLIARKDGSPIVWPEPTHCDPKKVSDMPLFGLLKAWRTAAECIDWSIPCPSIFERDKPLVEATMRRIAMGIKRYVLDAEKPFIVLCNHGGEHFRGQSVDEPFCTVTGSRDAHGLVMPILSKYHGQKGDESRCGELEQPFKTLDTQPRYALVSAFIAKHFGGQIGVPVDTPLPTTTMRGSQNQVVAASLVHMNHGEKQWSSINEPLRTVTSNNHAALVYAFLIRYFGTSIGQHVSEPLLTITGKDRFGLVTVTVAGEPYVIVDIGMRMLTPRELARAQGFPDTFLLTGTKTSQVARIGNSVCPQVAEAIIRANCSDMNLSKSSRKRQRKPVSR
jgi:site-specific DNA-cytosine methylase